MKILGIVAEYNPFHNGHKYHIEKAKELSGADAVVAVMSGNFVQRGAPAVADKWERAKWAVENGVNLAIELPVTFSLSSAEQFAYAAIYILNAIKCDYISFGTENELTEIKDAYNFYKSAEISTDSKTPYHISRTLSPEMEIIKTPNNILAFEYIKALDKLNSEIVPIGVKRCDNGYKSTDISEFSSATSIRNALFNNIDFSVSVSKNVNDYLINNTKVSEDMFLNLIKYSVLKSGTSFINNISEIREGLENKIYKVITDNTFTNYEELIKLIKSKRYTYSAISRMLFKILLGINKELSDNNPEYVRILAADSVGNTVIKQIKKECHLPVISKPANYKNLNPIGQELFEKDIFATDIYNLSLNKKGKADLTTSPVIIS